MGLKPEQVKAAEKKATVFVALSSTSELNQERALEVLNLVGIGAPEIVIDFKTTNKKDEKNVEYWWEEKITKFSFQIQLGLEYLREEGFITINKE